MFFIVQLTKVIPLMDFYIPAAIEMYYQEVRSMIDFEILTPDGIIGVFAPNQTLSSVVFGPADGLEAASNKSETSMGMQAAGAGSLSFVDNMMLFIFAFLVFLVVMIILGLLATLPCLRNRISKIIRQNLAGFFFNGWIQSFIIAYMATCILAVAQLKMFLISTDDLSEEDMSTVFEGAGNYAFNFLYPVFIIYWIRSRSDQLETPYA